MCVCSKAVIFFTTETISGVLHSLMQDPEIVSFTKTIQGPCCNATHSINAMPLNRLVYRNNFRGVALMQPPEIVSVNENITAPNYFYTLYLTFCLMAKGLSTQTIKWTSQLSKMLFCSLNEFWWNVKNFKRKTGPSQLVGESGALIKCSRLNNCVSRNKKWKCLNENLLFFSLHTQTIKWTQHQCEVKCRLLKYPYFPPH